MTVTEESLRKAITTITAIKEIDMIPQHLLLDILALSKVPAFSDDAKFNSVVHTISHGVVQIAQNPAIGDSLKNNFNGFRSLHIMSEYPTDPPHDDLRIVYQPETHPIWIICIRPSIFT